MFAKENYLSKKKKTEVTYPHHHMFKKKEYFHENFQALFLAFFTYLYAEMKKNKWQGLEKWFYMKSPW